MPEKDIGNPNSPIRTALTHMSLPDNSVPDVYDLENKNGSGAGFGGLNVEDTPLAAVSNTGAAKYSPQFKFRTFQNPYPRVEAPEFNHRRQQTLAFLAGINSIGAAASALFGSPESAMLFGNTVKQYGGIAQQYASAFDKLNEQARIANMEADAKNAIAASNFARDERTDYNRWVNEQVDNARLQELTDNRLQNDEIRRRKNAQDMEDTEVLRDRMNELVTSIQNSKDISEQDKRNRIAVIQSAYQRKNPTALARAIKVQGDPVAFLDDETQYKTAMNPAQVDNIYSLIDDRNTKNAIAYDRLTQSNNRFAVGVGVKKEVAWQAYRDAVSTYGGNSPQATSAYNYANSLEGSYKGLFSGNNGSGARPNIRVNPESLSNADIVDRIAIPEGAGVTQYTALRNPDGSPGSAWGTYQITRAAWNRYARAAGVTKQHGDPNTTNDEQRRVAIKMIEDLRQRHGAEGAVVAYFAGEGDPAVSNPSLRNYNTRPAANPNNMSIGAYLGNVFGGDYGRGGGIAPVQMGSPYPNRVIGGKFKGSDGKYYIPFSDDGKTKQYADVTGVDEAVAREAIAGNTFSGKVITGSDGAANKPSAKQDNPTWIGQSQNGNIKWRSDEERTAVQTLWRRVTSLATYSGDKGQKAPSIKAQINSFKNQGVLSNNTANDWLQRVDQSMSGREASDIAGVIRDYQRAYKGTKRSDARDRHFNDLRDYIQNAHQQKNITDAEYATLKKQLGF